jgi:hypothetical protein
MFSEQSRQEIEKEMKQAREARMRGLEGRARVSARRAAGAAVREFFRLHGEMINGATASAYDLLVLLQEMEGVPGLAREAAVNLLTRVDASFNIPAQIDLLAEADRLIFELDHFPHQDL